MYFSTKIKVSKVIVIYLSTGGNGWAWRCEGESAFLQIVFICLTLSWVCHILQSYRDLLLDLTLWKIFWRKLFEWEVMTHLQSCPALQSLSCFIAEGQIHWSSHFIPPQGKNCDLNYLVDIFKYCTFTWKQQYIWCWYFLSTTKSNCWISSWVD